MIDKEHKKAIINELGKIYSPTSTQRPMERRLKIAEQYNVGLSTIYRWEKELEKKNLANGDINGVIERLETVCSRLEQIISIWEKGNEQID